MTKILLVEDDKSLREIYGVRLQAEGYEIVSAGDGEEALALAIKDRPDLIVSDVMMPKISGFDMLDILRSTTETRDIKVIMMTALSSEDQRQRGEQLGADRYLVKSQVGIEDVVRTVHEVLTDAPAAPVGNIFAPPAPTAVATPAPTTPAAVQPPAPAAPTPVQTPAPMPPAVPTPAPTPAPAAAPVPVTTPVAPAAPVAPISTPTAPAVDTAVSVPVTSTPATLPEPTAPFSTDRPPSLANRVIEPLTKPDADTSALSDRINQELQASPEVTPVAPSTPAPATPPVPAPPVMGATTLNYEETPVAPAPPQPPAAA